MEIIYLLSREACFMSIREVSIGFLFVLFSINCLAVNPHQPEPQEEKKGLS